MVRSRFQPVLLVALLGYLVCSLVVAPLHQHHGGVASGDCARCTLAHTPAVAAPTSHQPLPTTEARAVVPTPDDRIADPDFLQISRSRAPPQS